MPVDPYTAPIEAYPAPATIQTYPAPVEVYPAPIESYPVPVEPAPAYTAPVSVYPPTPKPPIYPTVPVYQGSEAAPAPYEYDIDALSRGVPQGTSDALYITPVPKQAPARTQPSGYTVIDGVIEYVGEGQSAPASAGGLQPAVGSTYETMPAQYGEPVEVVPSAVPQYTPESYSAPRGVDVKGGYEYGN